MVKYIFMTGGAVSGPGKGITAASPGRLLKARGLKVAAQKPDIIVLCCYGKTLIHERRRHRYEFNNKYRDILSGAGMTLSGISPDGRLAETVELTDRPIFAGVQ